MFSAAVLINKDTRISSRPSVCVLLHDLQTGASLPVIDSGYFTAIRTGLGVALATNLFVNPDIGSVAVVGPGIPGECQLRYLTLLRPITKETIYEMSEKYLNFVMIKMSRINKNPGKHCKGEISFSQQ